MDKVYQLLTKKKIKRNQIISQTKADQLSQITITNLTINAMISKSLEATPINLIITMIYKSENAIITDNINHTINCDRVIKFCRYFIQNNAFNLIETLCNRLERALKKEFNIQQIQISAQLKRNQGYTLTHQSVTLDNVTD